MTRNRGFVVLTLLVWLLLGFTLWGLLQHIEFTCKDMTELNGLWAECYAPAAGNAVGIFVLIVVADLARCILVLRRRSGVQEASE